MKEGAGSKIFVIETGAWKGWWKRFRFQRLFLPRPKAEWVGGARVWERGVDVQHRQGCTQQRREIFNEDLTMI
jgi:hypothetical protein